MTRDGLAVTPSTMFSSSSGIMLSSVNSTKCLLSSEANFNYVGSISASWSLIEFAERAECVSDVSLRSGGMSSSASFKTSSVFSSLLLDSEIGVIGSNRSSSIFFHQEKGFSLSEI